MAGILPQSVRERTVKIGFSSPHTQWLKGPLRAYYFDHINSHRFLESPYWDGPKIRDMAERDAARERWERVAGTVKYIQAIRFLSFFTKET
jgi:hypothetical protein